MLEVQKVLFDSGALHASYISQSFIDKHKHYFSPILQYYPRRVFMADNVTSALTTHRVRVNLEFSDAKNVTHSGAVNFTVFDMQSNIMIIGLPDIIRTFGTLFIGMLSIAIESWDASLITSHEHLLATELEFIRKEIPYGADITFPWKPGLELLAPEDEDTDLPCSFTDALHYMELGLEDSISEYLEQVNSTKHIDSEFAKQTNVVKLLCEKGLKCFVPHNWEGIKGIPDLELDWKDTLPANMKPRARPVNPKLMENAEKEFKRLRTYFYVDSTSDICSPLVIAPKATKPFIRFCGDYVAVNNHIAIGHYPIPHVQHQLDKLLKFKIFLDIDWANAFHQIRLAPLTSQRLSIQTIWGEVKPLFMPEGIGPASGVLQSTVASLFSDYDEWSVAIFDNLLICAHDYADAYKKLEIILDRCIERNVVLKFSKTWLGFDHANFFGYVVKHKHYELSQDRKDGIMAIPFPNSLKAMQSFLGSALFFKSFMDNYSALCAPLNDTVRKEFDWKDRSSWLQDYEKIFNEFKTSLQGSVAIHYPDYSVEWILRVDASSSGVSAALLMKIPAIAPPATTDPDAALLTITVPISFASQKFSAQASRWSVIEQEAYACFFGVKKFAYYLHCKPFTLETDHNNLIWMEASAVPKIIRWRIYLQSFTFTLRHIPGRLMRIVDHCSRHFSDETVPPEVITAVSEDFILDPLFYLFYNLSVIPDLSIPEDGYTLDDQFPLIEKMEEGQQHLSQIGELTYTPTEALIACHNSRVGHGGHRKTWLLLNKLFPGHIIPFRIVSEYIDECPICQKDRLGMGDALTPLVRHLKRSGPQSTIGLDTLTITPPDKYGNQYLTVIVNHFTKLSAGYASSIHDAKTAAAALHQYFSTYGLVDQIVTDPGSEFRNELMNCLTAWYGVTHVFSLVDRHESNGVERTNREILRHLKALVMDERLKNMWSDNTTLATIFFILNSSVSSETGVVPFHAHFGNKNATYRKLPEGLSSSQTTHEYVKLLDDNLRTIMDISKRYQDNIVADRTAKSDPLLQNKFCQGDFVFFQMNPENPLPNKLHPKYLGPFEVLSQTKNDVECKNLIYGTVSKFHIERLKIFYGTREQAYKLAQIDTDQYIIRRFLSYRGDPDTRTTMEFYVEFEDNSKVWLPWSNDLFDTTFYEDYCERTPELFLLKYRLERAKQVSADINKQVIDQVELADEVFVDLRSYGSEWYKDLNLENMDLARYVLKYVYTEWENHKHRKIWVSCDLLDEHFKVGPMWIKKYGSCKILDAITMTLVDEQFIIDHPNIVSDRYRAAVLEKCHKTLN
jgi:hypothetical protein